MQRRTFTIHSPRNKLISMHVTPGHFTTNNSHFTHYFDMSRMKSNALVARDVAREIATPYLSSTGIDTIICMEETEVIGAYLAEELMENGAMVVNSDREIYVTTPKRNVNGQLIFQQSAQPMISGRHAILLVASAASGHTIHRALDCLAYYQGLLVGISSIFTAIPALEGHPVNSVFSEADVPGYHLYQPSDCALCNEGHRLDAIVRYDGYTQFR